MAKLIVLALAFTALVAFASAHTTTIVTTTIGEDNPISRQCSPQIQGESFNQCVRYLQQGQQQQGSQQQQPQLAGGQLVQQCCAELQQVNEPCQCQAVQHVFQKVQGQQQQQQGQQGGRYGSQQLQGLKMKAQNLPNQCNLQVRQCPIRTSISTTTIYPFWPTPFGSQQQCSPSNQLVMGNQLVTVSNPSSPSAMVFTDGKGEPAFVSRFRCGRSHSLNRCSSLMNQEP